MERAKKARTPKRACITKTIRELEVELAKDKPDHDELQLKLIKLEEVYMELVEMDRLVEDAMLDDDAEDDAIGAESEAIEGYRDQVRKIKQTVNKLLSGQIDHQSIRSNASIASNDNSLSTNRFKLPKIELKKFGGERTEWLSWWSQFEKIHLDENLHETDKFQYLVQATVEKSRARKLVESYPQTSANYPKAIDTLKDRFGDKILLTEVYVRKLLNLVITNVGKYKSESNLSNMYDELESNLRALESLGVTTDQSAAFLYPMVESSLPKELIQVWQRSSLSGYEDDEDKPTNQRLENLMRFLKIEVKGSERLSYVENGIETVPQQCQQNKGRNGGRQNSRQFNQSEVATAAGLFTGQVKLLCIFCDGNHPSQECLKAQQFSLKVKRDKIKEKKVCFQCLKKGHNADHCKAFVRCPLCTRRHYTLVCPELPSHKKEVPKPKEVRFQDSPQITMSNHSCSREVLLETVAVKVEGPWGTKIVRLLFDNGSQRSYIKKETANQLKLEATGEILIQKSLFSGLVTDPKKQKQFNVELSSLDGTHNKSIDVLEEPIICGGINRIQKGPWLEELAINNVYLNDFTAQCPTIEVLIGNDYYGQCLTGRIIQLKSGLTAKETIFGWTLGGRLPDQDNVCTATTIISMLTSEENTVQDLWALESIGIMDSSHHKTIKERDEDAIHNFAKTVTRNADGRYCVRLPWVNERQEIPSNKFVAEKRLRSATGKLNSAGKYNIYNKIFDDWANEGIIEVISGEDNNALSHYLPHRPVFKANSLTTPVRPVFDASCKVGRHPSLNDCLEKGPNLLEQIPTILLRFRAKRIGVISDIKKAFLQIQIQEEDCDYLRFLWWEDSSGKTIKTFRHKRVVFGVTSSPFLLNAVIQTHLKQVPEEFQNVAKELNKSIYVDNCVTSVDSLQDYQVFKSTSIKIMEEAKMDLCQWERSSGWEPGVSLQPIGCGLGSNGTPAPLKTTNVLGLIWNKETDVLYCAYEPLLITEKLTKRRILSAAQRIYDPIGFLAPALLLPKIILQEAWATKIGWDEELPSEITDKFGSWIEECHIIPKIQIPRYAMGNKCGKRSLHIFSDASKQAFATVIFLRTEEKGKVSVQLLLGKARVAPLKKTSIPRLELLGGLIGARLNKTVQEGMELQNCPCTFWSDSSTALAWIRRNDEWGTFVGNRVREICKLSKPDQWRHVPGIHNPADLPSRGCSFSELLASRWWEGPGWLKKPEAEWPVEELQVNEDDINCEKKKSTIFQQMFTSLVNPWYCCRSSNYQFNVKVMAWILRMLRRMKKQLHEKGPLTPSEIGSAEIMMFTLVQKEVFQVQEEVVGGIRVTKDKDGLLRVKTKLIHRPDRLFQVPSIITKQSPTS